MFRLGKASRGKLVGLHPDLILVIGRAISISDTDFSIIEGRRTIEKQREYLAAGKSKTMNSRHLTGHAVDLAPWTHGTIDWESWQQFEKVAKAMKAASSDLGIPVDWGGDWKTFKDGPHFELLWSAYPANPDDVDYKLPAKTA